MAKIIPILLIITSACALCAATIGLILICIALSVNPVAPIAVPIAIAACVVSLPSVGITLLFFKSKLCRVAFAIFLLAAALSGTAIIVWQIAML